MSDASDGDSGPEARLLTLGPPETFGEQDVWYDYAGLGITRADVPNLIAMATDPDLNVSEDELLAWGPLHAWRALGQLGAVEAIRPLVRLITDYPDDEWFAQELPQVFARIGPDALPVLFKIAANRSRPDDERTVAIEAIGRIGRAHPDLREDCRTAMRDRLADYARQSGVVNAFIVNSLLDVGAVEEIDLIRKAYRADAVDEVLPGDIEDVEIELGLRTERETPLRPLRDRLLRALDERPSTARSGALKVGRNAPCPCGSGKKYKRCCGNA